MSEKLKNCPFCGSKAEIISNQDGNIQQVRCSVCGARNFWGVNSKELWNKRTCKDTSLKPCPICGHKGCGRCIYDAFWVQCSYCGLSTKDFDNSDEAKAAWNRRHDDYV